jgi:hypothetical protein
VPGPTGPTGPQGATGPGVATGGATGTILVKNSATNYDTSWVVPYPNLPAPVTTGTTIHTFTDAIGDTWVAKNGINSGAWKKARDVLYTRVYRNAAFTVPAATAVFPYDTTSDDVYGMWTIASTLLTCPVAGLYEVGGFVTATGTSNNQYVTGALLKNGTVVNNGPRQYETAGGSVPLSTLVSGILRCAAGDTLQINAWASATLAAVTGTTNSYAGFRYIATG